MSGTDLLIIGRQVPTGFGGFIDLLALDAEGRVHVLELKRDRTPRDVVPRRPTTGPSSSATSPTAATSTWPRRGYSIPNRSRTRRLDRRAWSFRGGDGEQHPR